MRDDKPPTDDCERECGHCWHVTHTLTCNPPVTVSRCCHCGETKQKRHSVAGEEHGPYHPRRTTTVPMPDQNSDDGPFFGGNTWSGTVATLTEPRKTI